MRRSRASSCPCRLCSVLAISAAGFGIKPAMAPWAERQVDLVIKGGDVLDPSQNLRPSATSVSVSA